jgi:hypothetical protein
MAEEITPRSVSLALGSLYASVALAVPGILLRYWQKSQVVEGLPFIVSMLAGMPFLGQAGDAMPNKSILPTRMSTNADRPALRGGALASAFHLLALANSMVDGPMALCVRRPKTVRCN